ncbi:MAG: glutamate-5-semialdehyde dehydrogenase [Clostridia bacterium]|nr:glutamate-5-semialdehyde dehydrogenase [Clostridia bacterium]
MTDVQKTVSALCSAAKTASAVLAAASGDTRRTALLCMRDALCAHSEQILQSNAEDMLHAEQNGVSAPMQDRLRLTQARLLAIADALAALAALPDPIGEGEVFTRPNGLQIRRVRVPLGTVGIIYEARPNVTADAAGLCIKSGNTAVLRGGKEAIRTNCAIVYALRAGLRTAGLPEDCICLIEDTSRDSAAALMQMRQCIDVLIPRGGKGLIRTVVEQASVPVIETGAGNCHLYVDESADIEMAVSLTMNAKTQRPSVCNAIETLLVHASVQEPFFRALRDAIASFHTPVEIRGCARTRAAWEGILCASEEDWACEYDDYILAVRVVDSLEEAVSHINRFGTHHSECIVTRDLNAARAFQLAVDSACVYVNASTRFTDGEEFGFGAEIGISTQKLHARGPMGLTALTTIKYLIDGTGQCRT